MAFASFPFSRLRGERPLRGAAPEGLVPLDSLPPLRRGIGAAAVVSACCFCPPEERRAEAAKSGILLFRRDFSAEISGKCRLAGMSGTVRAEWLEGNAPRTEMFCQFIQLFLLTAQKFKVESLSAVCAGPRRWPESGSSDSLFKISGGIKIFLLTNGLLSMYDMYK